MQWRDFGEERGGNPGITFVSEDDTVIVSPLPDGQGGVAAEAWAVWDMTAPKSRPVFEGVVFKSREAAQKAAQAWKESALVWLVMRAAKTVQQASVALHGVAAGLAVRLADDRG